MHENLIDKLYDIYSQHGFISEKTIFNELEANGVSLFAVDRICDQLLSKGVIIRDDSGPGEKDDNYDRSNVDYNAILDEVIEIDESLRLIMEYVRGIKPPQNREWQNLIPQAQNGNTFAVNRIFEMYMRVAIKLGLFHAKKYKLSLSDTIQDALLGLYIAIDKFDISRHENFQTYFPFWVKQSIMRNAETVNTSLYFPVHLKDKLFAIYDNIEDYFGGDISDKPSDELIQDIAEELECDFDYAQTLFDYLITHVSVDEILEEDEELLSDKGLTSIEMIENIENDSNTKDLMNKISVLSEKEKKILFLRYGLCGNEPMTLEEIGGVYNVSRERVRQIELKAMKKLRKKYNIVNGHYVI